MDIWTKELGHMCNLQLTKAVARACSLSDFRSHPPPRASYWTPRDPDRSCRIPQPTKLFPPTACLTRTATRARSRSLWPLGLCSKTRIQALFLRLKLCHHLCAKWSRKKRCPISSRDANFPTTSLTTRKTRPRTEWIAFGHAKNQPAKRDSVSFAALKTT